MINEQNTQLLIDFADNGFEFFPLVKPWGGAKLGTPKGWPEICTDHIPTIHEWLKTAKYGFGMSFKLERCFAIDLDMKEAVDGVANFKEAMVRHDIPAPSLIFSTPSGGRHLIYKHPDNISIKNIAGFCFDTGQVNQGTGIDIRAKGGFIGSFGARDNGYKLLVGKPSDKLVPLPDAIVKILPMKVTQSQLAASALAMTKGLANISEKAKTQTSLYGVIPKEIFDGERDNTLFNLIASWVRSGLDRSNIIILVNEAVKRCEGTVDSIPVIDMVDRTLSNPDFIYAKRSKALQILLKNLVFLEDINKYMTLHNKSILVKDACMLKFNTPIEVAAKSDGEPKFLPLFKIWCHDDSRLSYKNYGYKPINESVYWDDTYRCNLVNTYSKPNIIPKENMELFDKFCEFAAVICDDEEKGMILVEFIAYMIQNPAVKIGVAPVVISTRQGVGKNFFMKIVEKLLGGENVTQLYSDNLTNNFNSSIARSQLITINESIGEQSGTYSAKAKNAQTMARIKSMITDYVQPIERKGQDIITMRTYTNFIFFSNDISAVNFDMYDRRFLCIINDQSASNKSFFDSMDVLKEKDGQSAILYGLKSMKLKRIFKNMTHTDKTGDDIEVMKQSMTSHEEEIYEDIQNGQYIFKSDFISANLFIWYCVYKFGFDTQRDKPFINKLRKQFFVPLYLSKEYRAAKQIKMTIPKFHVPIKNGTDSVTFGGNTSHSMHYLKPVGHNNVLYAEKMELKFLKDRILKSTQSFIDGIENKDPKPELALVSGVKS